MRTIGLAVATALASGIFLTGCTAQLSQADRDLLNQALQASESAVASAQRAGAAADRAEGAATRAEAAARRAESSAAQAQRSAEDAKKAFDMSLTK